jgi:putative membrane protein
MEGFAAAREEPEAVASGHEWSAADGCGALAKTRTDPPNSLLARLAAPIRLGHLIRRTPGPCRILMDLASALLVRRPSLRPCRMSFPSYLAGLSRDALRPPPRPEWAARAFRYAFWGFVISAAFSLAGSAALYLPGARAFFDPYMYWLVRIPTWTYMALLPVLTFLLYLGPLGWGRSVALLVWGSVIGAGAELMGTTTGFPFGPYLYLDLFGYKIAGHVPLFIPPSWYALGLICYDLAGRMRLSGAGRIAAASLCMVAWDVALDPAMSYAYRFWMYPGSALAEAADGALFPALYAPLFYGMPLMNWVGWFVTSLVIMAGFWLVLRGVPFGAAQQPPAPALFALHCLFPVGVSLFWGIPGASVFGLAALLAVLVALRWREGAPQTEPVRAAEPVAS